MAAIGRSSFTLRYEIVQAGKELVVAVGRTVMVTYDYSARKSVPLPEAARELLERLQRREGDTETRSG